MTLLHYHYLSTTHAIRTLPFNDDEDDMYTPERHLPTPGPGQREHSPPHTAAGTAAPTTTDTGNTVPQRADPAQTAYAHSRKRPSLHPCVTRSAGIDLRDTESVGVHPNGSRPLDSSPYGQRRVRSRELGAVPLVLHVCPEDRLALARRDGEPARRVGNFGPATRAERKVCI